LRQSTKVKLELRNSRYADRDLKERLTELVHYSKYAGITLEHFHKAIAGSILAAGSEGLGTGQGGKLILETNYKTATSIARLVEMYPVFSSWDIKFTEVKRRIKPKRQATNNQKEIKMAAKKKAKKKPAKKKKAAKKKKPAKKKKAAKKKKPAKKKKAAKKKKPAKKKKAAKKKKPAKKKKR